MSKITEEAIENLCIDRLKEQGYQYIYGPDIAPDGDTPWRSSFEEVILSAHLSDAVARINPDIPADARQEAIKVVSRIQSPDLLTNNEVFHRMLTEGVKISYQKDGSLRGDLVWLVDFANPLNNEFLVVNQYTVIENGVNKRPDVVVFVNGLPLVVVELKNAADENASVLSAYKQLQTYKESIPSLFTYNGFLVISDGLEARAGSLSAGLSRFMAWKTADGKKMASPLVSQLETLIEGMLNKTTLLDLLRHFIVFEKMKSEDPETGVVTMQTVKKLAAYHQYYAVNRAVESTLRATGYIAEQQETESLQLREAPVSYGVAGVENQPKGDRRGGVVWHTQGSGKSLSMVFFTGKIVLALANPTILVITDRNDLDDQLFDTFAASTQLLRQEPKQVENRNQLKELLQVASGGVIFSTIQKFQPEEGNVFETLSLRQNIVVIAESTDTNTPAVFGNYIDVYDIAHAVEDGATVPIFYESRLAKVALNEEGKQLVEELDAELAQDELTETQQAKAKWTQLEALIGSERRITNIAQDIVAHFEQRQAVFAGKAMIVAMSRRIAADLYAEITRIKPDWHSDELNKGAIKVVMTSSSSDGPQIARHHTTKAQRKILADRMKHPDDPLQLVIVRDMWLTGFDAPCLHTLYIDKPMKGHNLMQAIARVNRVYKDKPGGLIVDYLGIASDLKRALSFYSDAGGKGDPTLLQEQAVDLMLEKLEVVSQLFHGFAYEEYFAADTAGKLSLILAAEDHILGIEDGKKRYVNEVTALSKAFAIAIPHEQAMDIKDEVAFFQAVKARLVKFDATGAGRSDAEIETTIRQVIDQALVSEQVIDVFDAAGIKKPDISILSEEFLLELRGMEHKHVALEVLKKLLNDELKSRSRKNLVKSKSLIEMLENSIKKYHNKIVTAAEVIDELIALSKEIVSMDNEASKLGLSEFEYAFYTAVADNESARELMQHDTLRELAVVLTERVRQNASIDWTIKESVRAKLKVTIKRTLRQYGYPPDMQKLATETVLKQAELIASELAGEG
ncbi:MAG: DEAD/DEAH box helicase [Acidobacteria bacterium]|nr:MAG: DEAD/DEAH box helicase [Acidobacteriota bacterium]